MIKTLLLALALSACTRYVPAPTTPTAKGEPAPAPKPAARGEYAIDVSPTKPTDLYHHAEDVFLKTTIGKGATCVRERATPEADSATCTTAKGDVVMHVWDSTAGGFGSQVLVAPQPSPAPEATKKK